MQTLAHAAAFHVRQACQALASRSRSGHQQLRCLVVCASQFSHIIEDAGVTAGPYNGHPLSKLSPRRRGLVLQTVARKVLSDIEPGSTISDPIPGMCVNGKRRSLHQAEWDWTISGRRVECKSAMLSWWSSLGTWRVQFPGVKLPLEGVRDEAPFDDLFLVLYSPQKLNIIQHDLKTGVSSAGARTAPIGHCIVRAGKSNQTCWKESLATILRKFQESGSFCKHVAEVDVDCVEVEHILAQELARETAQIVDHAYANVPLAGATSPLRGFRIQSVAYEIDRILNPSSSFCYEDGIDTDGPGPIRVRRRSKVDWTRDGRRVEIKHSKLFFNKSNQAWECEFKAIKFAHEGVRKEAYFDELWLALYSPAGIHFIKHNGTYGVSSAGIRSEALGGSVYVYGPRNQLSVLRALDEMLCKLQSAGCQLLATVLWHSNQKECN